MRYAKRHVIVKEPNIGWTLLIVAALALAAYILFSA